MEPLGVLPSARHGHDPARGRVGRSGPEQRQQMVDQEERPEDQGREAELEPIDRDRFAPGTSRRRCRPGRPAGSHARGSRPPRRGPTRESSDRRRRSRWPDRPTRRRARASVRSSLAGSRPTSSTRAPIAAKWLTAARPSPGGRSGHQDRPTGERRPTEVLPAVQPAAQVVTDPAEARQHEHLERIVDDVAWLDHVTPSRRSAGSDGPAIHSGPVRGRRHGSGTWRGPAGLERPRTMGRWPRSGDSLPSSSPTRSGRPGWASGLTPRMCGRS